ncbi:MAG: hypothetical protein H0W90_02525 [Actinobacteria bacterium]|nr:hypothetical protein [Actinomycetota bacterium]
MTAHTGAELRFPQASASATAFGSDPLARPYAIFAVDCESCGVRLRDPELFGTKIRRR